MTIAGHQRSLTCLEQSGLAARRRGQPKMGIAATVEAAPACGAGDEAELNEVRLDHVLDRVARLAEAGGQRFDADRPAAVKVGDHRQVAAVHRVESERVDLQPRQRAVGDLGVDRVGAEGMREIPHPAQQAAGDPRRAA